MEDPSLSPPAGQIDKWDLPPEPVPSWLDPATEVTVEPGGRPAPRGPFVVASMTTCLELNCDPRQAAGVVANAINETGWGRAYRAFNFGGVKITPGYVGRYRAAHGGHSPPWTRAPGNRSSGDPPWCYYRAYPSLRAFFAEWLAAFVPAPGTPPAARYAATGRRFWAGKPWFAELIAAGYKGSRTKDNPGSSLREHDALVVTALRMWAQSRLGVAVDGVWGQGSREALTKWQTQRGLPASGALDDATLSALAGAAPGPNAGRPVDRDWPEWAPARYAAPADGDLPARETSNELDRLLDALARRSPEERRRFGERLRGLLGEAGGPAPRAAGFAMMADLPTAALAAPPQGSAAAAPIEAVDDRAREEIAALVERARGDGEAGEVEDALRRALAQADRGGSDPLGFSDAVSHEDEYYLALLRAAREEAERSRRAAPPAGPPMYADLWGTRQFEKLDKGWIGSFTEMLRAERAEFPTHLEGGFEPVVPIADDATFALAGDWGTGSASSLQLALKIAERKTAHTVHLGDVYYAGTPEEVRRRFLAHWPAGTDPAHPSFALNANHEMYAGGHGYFGVMLQDARFKGQRGLSYFALENAHWTVVGFDSAYHSQRRKLYQDGALDPMQAEFIRATVRRAREQGRRVIALCHHHGIGTDGDLVQPWWDTVMEAFGGGPDGWYFGHEHAAVAYAPVKTPAGREVRARCVGHGGVPYAPVRRLAHGVVFDWCESQLAGDIDEDRRALNGFLVLELVKDKARETFFDEEGRERWTSTW